MQKNSRHFSEIRAPKIDSLGRSEKRFLWHVRRMANQSKAGRQHAGQSDQNDRAPRSIAQPTVENTWIRLLLLLLMLMLIFVPSAEPEQEHEHEHEEE
jgi:hypothetical protein